MSLYDEGLRILKARQVVFAEDFVPYFFVSYACHCFNLMNRRRAIYYEHGRLPDMRCHLLFVAPPGFSKSFFMRHCFDPDFGILWTKTVPTVFQGSCTEAGWTGSISGNSNNPIKSVGLAEEYRNGIVAIEEFTAITKAMQQEHSLAYEAQLCSSLFGGEVRKRLRAGKIEYHTDVTLIAGTQITRFDISGGLGRRFNYIYWVPTPSDFKTLIEAVRRGANVPLDRSSLYDYRAKLMDWQRELNKIQKVEFSDRLYDYLDGRPHFEQLVYRKIALGYCLFATPKITARFYVDLDDRLKDLLRNAWEWRDALLADPEAQQVLEVLKAHGGRMKRLQLQTELLNYSLNWQRSSYVIERLIRIGYLRRYPGGVIGVV